MDPLRKSAEYLSGICATTESRASAPNISIITLSTLRSTGPRTWNRPAKRWGKGRIGAPRRGDMPSGGDDAGVGLLRIVFGASGAEVRPDFGVSGPRDDGASWGDDGRGVEKPARGVGRLPSGGDARFVGAEANSRT